MAFIIGTPHARGAGYYRSDNKTSGGKLVEADFKTCAHCQMGMLMTAWKEEGGWCGKCMKPICHFCADRMLTHGCEPFEAKIAAAIEAGIRRARLLGS
jgi:ribosomal protein S27AE